MILSKEEILTKTNDRLTRYIIAAITAAIILLFSTDSANAQYYSWGSDAPELKWRSIKTPEFRIIYPDTVDGVARRTLHFLNEIKDDIGVGYTYDTPLKMPIVMHPENFASNGLVMFMPRRVEYLTTPATDSYSMPWIKQLVAHETRHMVQYNNVNQGVIKALSRILGDQASTIGLLFFPVELLEGDAVFAETSMSTYGRGLQPSYTMGYRAMGREILERKNLDWLYCDSYRRYVPNHYELGYQLVTYTYNKYDENIWNNVVNFSVRKPYFFASNKVALRRLYDTSRNEILRDTFEDLLSYWESLPERENSTVTLSKIDTTNYTTYTFPTATKNNEIIALKSDYATPQRFVKIDAESGEEQRVAFTGAVSTRHTIGDNRVWWSEYRRSKLFDQRVFSQLCYLDLNDSNDNNNSKSKTKSVAKLNNVLYPTAINNSDNHFAYVEYTPNGQYTIVEARIKEEEKQKELKKASQIEEISRTEIKYPTEIHGLAWDNKTNEIYFIATDNSGMWLGARDMTSKNGYRQLRKGAYITLSDLSAKDGVLYFGSIESGYDEIHSYDIKSGTEHRLSQSKYGSFDPSTPIEIDGEEYTIATTYDKHGYHISRQKRTEIYEKVNIANVPQNIVNPERKMLDLPNIDQIDFTPADSLEQTAKIKSHKYSKPGGALNIHSWFPLYVNLYDVMDEQALDINLGATIISQNLLSNTDAYAAYGYSFKQGNIFSAGANYNALGVQLSFRAKYGGDQLKYDPFGTFSGELKNHYSLYGSAYLPIYYQRGYRSRQLALSTSWTYLNSYVANIDELIVEENGYISNANDIGYSKGLHKMSFGIYYAEAARQSLRDLASPLSYSFGLSCAIAPANKDFSKLARASASLTTRGFRPHNAISISACYQTSIGGYRYDNVSLLSFSSYSLIPTGYTSADVINNNYKAAAIRYSFPVWYPDGGISSLLFIKRLTLNAGLNLAHFTNPNKAIYGAKDEFIYSYGGGMSIDFVPFRMPDAGTMSLNVSLYKPKRGNPTLLMGFDLPI
ncbi:MAG: hypothetical protein SNH79_02460 [Rikenellaceae bacterium]